MLLLCGDKKMEKSIDLLPNDSEKGATSKHDDALINKVALELAGAKSGDLMTFQKAPDSALTRYGLVTVQGLGYIPEGVVNSAKDYIEHPTKALATVAMGAGMAVALKAVLPEAGPAGKIAGAALGAYFLYKSAEPVIDAYKQAGAATNMRQLDTASRQIGNVGGAFIVDGALAGVGYKAGSFAAGKLLAMPMGQSFVSARDNFYNNVGAKVSDAFAISPLENAMHPKIHGVVPPYLMDELATRNPGNTDFLNTRNKTLEMQQNHKPDGSPMPRNEGGAQKLAPRETYDAMGKEQQPGQKARFEGEKPTGNVDVDRAHDFTGDVREFYAKEFNRGSIDGKNMKYVSTVNYGQNFENAFWDGNQMTYGKPGKDSPFKTFILRDVAAHEITHGITEKEANVRYYGQAGALNESHSDVFGVLTEQYTKKQTADKASWKVGEGIWKDNIKGDSLRNMEKPGTAYNDPAIGKDPQPAHMKDYIKTWGDNGGVHYNSGIPNKAFADFAKSVGGNAWEAPGHIWFEARRNAGSNPSFASFAAHTIEAANKLGFADKVPKLDAAWKGVGVIADINAVDVLTPGAGGDGALAFLTRMFKKAS